ncbi:MAG: phytoene desaturase family protein [Flavobacteriaceae bacterium]|nr:phytoene desaturase family protein [Flavobacteriaceae bacterium]
MKKIIIIGSGFSSLAASCYLAKEGFNVTVLEKNISIGGRASLLQKHGFKFDKGPTWYWMPDVFERFFNDFNQKVSDFYQIEKLNPAYEVVFSKSDSIKIPDNLEEIYQIFEKNEKGSSKHLKEFMISAQQNYEVAIKDLVYKPGISFLELVTLETLQRINQFFTSISNQVRKKIKNEKLRQILEFPVLFLGAKPSDTPAFYNFMNYADFGLGTWHPKGGMYEVIKGITELAISLGVEIKTQQNVEEIVVNNNEAKGVIVNNELFLADAVLSGADYHHTERLLKEPHRQYTEQYWNKKTFAPSSLLFYVGFNKKLKNVSHHTLFFDTSFDNHAKAIYDNPSWPEKPLFYGSFPSISDGTFAPEGKEAGIFLIPIAPGIQDTLEIREKYFEQIIDRFEKLTNQEVKSSILFKESFCVNDFVSEYNSYKGNAYGLANTLFQTAFLRPKIKSSKVKNLFFTGQLTVPGPGVPPALISGKIASGLIINYFLK